MFERVRDRERESVCVCVRLDVCGCVCVWEREKERERLCACVCIFVERVVEACLLVCKCGRPKFRKETYNRDLYVYEQRHNKSRSIKLADPL